MKKANNMDARMSNLEAMMAQMLSHPMMQETGQAQKPTRNDEGIDNDVILVPVGKNRIKLPKRMFRKGKAIVGGVTFTALDSDAGRSAPINAGDVFDAPEGSTLEFTRIKGNQWDFDVLDSRDVSFDANKPVRVSAKSTSPKKSKGQKSSKPDFKSKRTKAQQEAWDNAPRHEITGNRAKDIKRMFATVVDQCIANANDPKFVPNANVKATDAKSKYGLDVDAREYLTSEQNIRFRRARKQLGLTLEEAIRTLNGMIEFE